MKIGIDASGIYGWRGPSRNIRNIIRSLIENDDSNYYLLFTYKQPDYDMPKKNNFCWVQVNKSKFIPWLNVLLPISVIIHKADLFIFPQANFWLWKPVKTIVLTRAAKIEAWQSSFVDRMQAFCQRIRFNHIADKVCAVTHFNASQITLSCNVDPKKFSIVNNGVDPVFLDTNIKPNKEYGKYIFYTGGTEPRKNIKNLLFAFKILSNKMPDLSLIIVGGKYAPSEPALEEYTKTINDINIQNKVVLYGIETDSKKLASLYRGALATVYPSFQEDFGMVSVEAMACGSPLVVSNAPSIPEICGDAVIYFDPYDIKDIADKIETVITNNDLRKALIAKGYERVKLYDWEKSVAKLLDIIEEVSNK